MLATVVVACSGEEEEPPPPSPPSPRDAYAQELRVEGLQAGVDGERLVVRGYGDEECESLRLAQVQEGDAGAFARYFSACDCRDGDGALAWTNRAGLPVTAARFEAERYQGMMVDGLFIGCNESHVRVTGLAGAELTERALATGKALARLAGLTSGAQELVNLQQPCETFFADREVRAVCTWATPDSADLLDERRLEKSSRALFYVLDEAVMLGCAQGGGEWSLVQR